MSQTSALAVIGIALLAICAAVVQAAHAIARGRIRRRGKMMRMCSVVSGSPADAPGSES